MALDDSFLEEVGLQEMPTAQRMVFLEHTYQELELRVGSRLSSGLSDSQLSEFESLIDRDLVAVTRWVESHAPHFSDDALYARMVEKLASTATPETLLCEYAATKWLEVNRPGYRDLVASELDQMKAEIRDRATDIRALF